MLEKQPAEKQPDGIEILVDMAKSGKIDPWNIDIVDVTDKYLQHLVELKSNNLKFTGRTLLFAAVLLRLKSDVLEGIDPLADLDEPETEEYEQEDVEFFDNEVNTNNIISLDEALTRRSSVRLNRQRVVTLKDLIRQLEFYEKIEKKKSLHNAKERAKRRARSYADFTPDDILDIAHEEYIEEGIDSLHEILLKLFETNEKVELSELHATGMDKISIYITLLFLAARSRIDLVQDEFYSDLYIVQGA